MECSQFDSFDEAEIYQLFKKTFSDSDGESEGDLIGNLVLNLIRTTAPADVFGFVATENDRIVGSIFFSRLTFDAPLDAFILSPVAVDTGFQGRGVGQQLINHGIAQLREHGVNLLLTYGDPAFYSKVGFRHITEEVAQSPWKLTQPEGWLCQALDGGEIRPIPGRPACVAALNDPAYW